MPPVSHSFSKGAIVILMFYNDHDPLHVHVKYQNDYRSYRIEIRTRRWMKPGKELSTILKKMVENWVMTYEMSYWTNGKMLGIINLFRL